VVRWSSTHSCKPSACTTSTSSRVRGIARVRKSLEP